MAKKIAAITFVLIVDINIYWISVNINLKPCMIFIDKTEKGDILYLLCNVPSYFTVTYEVFSY